MMIAEVHNMQFYKFEGITTDERWSEENDNRRVKYERIEKISIKTGSFNQREKRKAQGVRGLFH